MRELLAKSGVNVNCKWGEIGDQSDPEDIVPPAARQTKWKPARKGPQVRDFTLICDPI